MKKSRTLWITVTLVAALLACTRLMPNALEPADLEGRWDVTKIDGQSVSQEGYKVVFENGRIMHGFDGCNHWSRQLYEDKWLIVGTAIGCPQKILRQAYSQATGNDAQMQGARNNDGTLDVSSAGHTLTLARSEDQEPIRR